MSFRKIKVIGYPFAVSGKCPGSTLTPQWLSSQRWFRKLRNVQYEQVNVSEIDHKRSSEEEAYQIIIQNSLALQKHTYQAFKDGFYPVVVGGDNSQALGAVLGMKRFRPAAKTVILNTNIDLNNGDENKFSALEHLTGLRQGTPDEFKSVNLTQDIAFVGARRQPGSYEYVQQRGGTIIGHYHVLYQDTNQIHDLIHRKLSQNQAKSNDLWLSCSGNVIDSSHFMSKQRSYFGMKPGDGVSYDFLTDFIRVVADESIGMDLCDFNFEITRSNEHLQNLERETFRDLFQNIVESVQGSHHLRREQPFKKVNLTIGKPQAHADCPKPKNTKLKTTVEMRHPQTRSGDGDRLNVDIVPTQIELKSNIQNNEHSSSIEELKEFYNGLDNPMDAESTSPSSIEGQQSSGDDELQEGTTGKWGKLQTKIQNRAKLALDSSDGNHTYLIM